MSTEPTSSPEPAYPGVVRWPGWLRRSAAVLWSGFLGSALMLLALVMGWEMLFALETPSWAGLTVVFMVCWLITCVVATMAISLATRPRPQPPVVAPPPRQD